MPQGQGIQPAHGYPGTPVGDLFPLGQAVLGSGSQSSLRPIRAGELRAHSAGYEPNAPYAPCGHRNVRENRGRSPRVDNAEVLGRSIRMVGQFLHMRQSDNEQMASRVTFELEEQTASAVREEQLRDEYAQAADALRAELSEEAAQRFQYLEHQQNIFAQARLRTVESALGCEYASAQQNLQQQYLTQVQGLHNELQTAQRRFEESISQERASNGQELDTLRRELADKNQLIREQANDLQQDQKLRLEWHTNEEARAHETLAMQASQWKSHCEELTQHYDAQVAQDAERISEMERDLDDLSSKFIDASEKLEQWESWWKEGSLRQMDAQVAEPIDRQHEVLGPIIEEERQQQPMTPIVMAPPTIPQEFLPPPLPPKFAHKNFPKRANESDESSHTGMDAQAMPTFAPTTPLSGHKPTQPSMTSAPSTPLLGPGRQHVKSCNPKIRVWITTLAQAVAGSVMHQLCRCIHHPEWASHHLLLLSPTLTPWELQVLHHKLAHHRVGS